MASDSPAVSGISCAAEQAISSVDDMCTQDCGGLLTCKIRRLVCCLELSKDGIDPGVEYATVINYITSDIQGEYNNKKETDYNCRIKSEAITIMF